MVLLQFIAQEAHEMYTAVQIQKTLSACFTSKQIQPFGFAEQCGPTTLANDSETPYLTCSHPHLAGASNFLSCGDNRHANEYPWIQGYSARAAARAE